MRVDRNSLQKGSVFLTVMSLATKYHGMDAPDCSDATPVVNTPSLKAGHMFVEQVSFPNIQNSIYMNTHATSFPKGGKAAAVMQDEFN